MRNIKQYLLTLLCASLICSPFVPDTLHAEQIVTLAQEDINFQDDDELEDLDLGDQSDEPGEQGRDEPENQGGLTTEQASQSEKESQLPEPQAASEQEQDKALVDDDQDIADLMDDDLDGAELLVTADPEDDDNAQAMPAKEQPTPEPEKTEPIDSQSVDMQEDDNLLTDDSDPLLDPDIEEEPVTDQSDLSSASTELSADEQEDPLLTDDDDQDSLLSDNDDLLSDEDNLLEDDDEIQDEDLLADDYDDDILDDEDEEPGNFDPKSGIVLTIAPFGELYFAPSPEAIENGEVTEKGKENQKHAKERTYNLAPPAQSTATISKTRLHVKKNGNLSFTGLLGANGHRGKIKLKSYEDGVLLFDVKLSRKVRLQVTSDRELMLDEFKLSVENGEFELYSEQPLFTDDEEGTKISFGLTNNSEATATTEELPLPVLMPSANDNKVLKDVMLEELIIHMKNPFATQAGPAEVVIECEAKLDHIKLWGDTNMVNSSCTITIDQDEFELEASGNTPLIFDPDVILQNPEMEVRKQRDEKIEFLIGGQLDFKLPVLGKMKIPVKGERRDDGIEMRGALKNSVKFGPVRFGTPTILVYTTDGTAPPPGAPEDTPKLEGPVKPEKKVRKIEVQGISKLFGLSINPILRFIRTGNGKRMVEFSGKFDSKENLNPLSHIPGLKSIPGLGDFDLKKAFIGLDATKAFFIGGLSNLFNVAGNVKVLMGKVGRQVKLGSTKVWKLSDSIPAAKGTVFDSIVLDNINFNASSFSGFDHENNIPFDRGINAFGTVSTNQGVFKNIRKILGGALPKKIICSVVINPNPRHCKLIMTLPFDVKLSSKAMMHSISFEISGEPSIALMLTLKFTPSKGDPPLLFVARIEFELIGCALSGTMQGFWHHPFGIKGLHVGNLAIEMKFPYAAPPVPIAFGLAGTMQIGDFLLSVAVKLGMDDIILMGEISELPIYFLPQFLEQVGMGNLGPITDALETIDIKLEDFKFKFAPVGGQIGILYFEPGVSGQGKLILKIPGIMDTFIEAGFNLDLMSGFKMYGRMPKTKIGPLTLTGKGQDRKYGTKDDGPGFYCALGLSEQRIFASARASCLGNRANVEADIKLTSLKLHMDMDAYLTPLILMGVKNVLIDAESYREGWKIGLRGKAEIGFGGARKKWLVDIGTAGATLSARLGDFTLNQLAGGLGIPTNALPDIGLDSLESYCKFEPVKAVSRIVKKHGKKAAKKTLNTAATVIESGAKVAEVALVDSGIAQAAATGVAETTKVGLKVADAVLIESGLAKATATAVETTAKAAVDVADAVLIDSGLAKGAATIVGTTANAAATVVGKTAKAAATVVDKTLIETGIGEAVIVKPTVAIAKTGAQVATGVAKVAALATVGATKAIAESARDNIEIDINLPGKSDESKPDEPAEASQTSGVFVRADKKFEVPEGARF